MPWSDWTIRNARLDPCDCARNALPPAAVESPTAATTPTKTETRMFLPPARELATRGDEHRDPLQVRRRRDHRALAGLGIRVAVRQHGQRLVLRRTVVVGGARRSLT